MTTLGAHVAQDERAYLESLIFHGMKLGLHNIQALMEAGGSPYRCYPVVHVGGTNGKVSVVAFLDAILRAAGYRVGRFTSPHLLDVTERFLINGVPMTETALAEHIAHFRQSAEQANFTPTYFEMNTAIAFREFALQSVDVALVEVGMGGRFDATNIVEPKLCIITNIDYDHMQYLGDTLEKIAFEKAGIVKPAVPAVLGPMAANALNVITSQAREKGAPYLMHGKDYHFSVGGASWRPTLDYHGLDIVLREAPLSLCGRHQGANAAIAVTLAMLLRPEFPRIHEDTIRAGLSAATWPGRLERVLDAPPVIMDVAHNPAGCRSMAEALEHCVTVFSVSSDKDASAMLDILAPISNPLILTEYGGGRSLPLETLRLLAKNKPHLAYSRLSEALEAGMRLAAQDKPLLVTGSIYAAGEARRWLIEQYGARAIAF